MHFSWSKLVFVMMFGLLLTSCSGVYAENLNAGKTALQEGKYEEAMRLLKTAIDEKPKEKEPQSLYNEAENKLINYQFQLKIDDGKKLFQEGKFDDAIAMLNALSNQEQENSKIDKESFEKLKALIMESTIGKQLIDAKKLISQGNYNEAKNILEKITDTDTDIKEQLISVKDTLTEVNANIDILKAKSNFEAGNYGDAIATLTKLLENEIFISKFPELKKTSEENLRKATVKQKLELGKNDFKEGDYDSAIVSLSYVTDNEPNNDEAKKLIIEAKQAIEDEHNKQIAIDFLKRYSEYINSFNNKVMGKINSEDYGVLENAKNAAYNINSEIRTMKLPSDEFDNLHSSFLGAIKYAISTIDATQQVSFMTSSATKLDAYSKAFTLSSYVVKYVDSYSDERTRLFKKYGI